jgi:hypothetical protein
MEEIKQQETLEPAVAAESGEVKPLGEVKAASEAKSGGDGKLSDEDLKRIVEGTLAALGGRKEETEARASLEQQLQQLKQTAEEYKLRAEAAERGAAVREELRKLGVTNVELAYRAVKEEVVRGGDGRLKGRAGEGEVELGEYLSKFVEANPELLPARKLGGAGSVGRRAEESLGMDMDSIRPGMDPAEMERARREVARVISRSLPR